MYYTESFKNLKILSFFTNHFSKNISNENHKILTFKLCNYNYIMKPKDIITAKLKLQPNQNPNLKCLET